MRFGADSCTERDRALVAAALTGTPDAVRQFLSEISGTVWASCRALSGYEGEARDNFLETIAWLRASDFAAFKEYDGRSSLKTFTALVVREFYCRKLIGLFELDAARAWRMLQDFLEVDIRRLIRRHVRAPEAEEIRRDLYQGICLHLIEQNYRRIRAWSGKGSFSGFILRCAGNILRDEIRRTIAPRRRGPAAVARLEEIDPFAEAVEPSPEDIRIEAAAGEQLSAALRALTEAVQSLPEDERLYLSHVLTDSPPPPRELARVMRRPVREIYALKQRVLSNLRKIISEDSAVKDWLASV